ncbi:MAG: peptidylprolyl isomerase [Proteobacteria bacterium]|nr:peptidylprolyl isomerase [Pseudomonadota bacterium]
MARAPIRLNGVTLPPHMIAAEAQHHRAKSPAAAFQIAARALIVRTLLLEEAARRHIAAAPDFVAEGKRETEDEARIRALLDANVPIPTPSEEACRAFYEANASQFHSPELFEASHILFTADPKDVGAMAQAEAKARAAIAEIVQKPELFETRARDRSDCDSRNNGGRLGQIAKGETVEFESALMALKPGAVAPEPVKTRFGVHVLRLDARVEGKVLPFDYVRDRIEAYLAEKQWRLKVADFIDRLMNQAVVEGIDLMRNLRRDALVA